MQIFAILEAKACLKTMLKDRYAETGHQIKHFHFPPLYNDTATYFHQQSLLYYLSTLNTRTRQQPSEINPIENDLPRHPHWILKSYLFPPATGNL